jgi:hypothetical protein
MVILDAPSAGACKSALNIVLSICLFLRVFTMATYNFLQGATGAMQIAGNLSGVPYAGAVATLAAGIVEVTRQVQVHKVSAGS